jgi:hypothetical protein
MEQQEFNFNEHKEPGSEGLRKVHELARTGFKQKRVVDDIKSALKKEEERLSTIQEELLGLLKEGGLTEVKIEGCGKVTVDTRLSVRVPTEPTERAAFFSWLKERGFYDGLITVNSQTLNALYNEELQVAKEQGLDDFKIPGLSPSGEWSKLRFK